MLEDPEKFYKEYITKEIPRKEVSAFDVGTYFHTAILEPHLLEKECAVYPGAIRRGKEWDAFKETHKGKAIITGSEFEQAQTMIRAVRNSPIALSYIDGFDKEVSAFIDLFVFDSDIYHVHEGKAFILRRNGWREDDMDVGSLNDFAVKVRIKVRADAISFEKKAISDLKSTTGNTKSEFFMRSKIDSYQYDLSASLYLDIFSAAIREPMNEFAWLFASKDYGNCQTWVASEKNVIIGRSKWARAVVDLAYYISNDWTFTDSVRYLDPSYFQLEHIDKIKE